MVDLQFSLQFPVISAPGMPWRAYYPLKSPSSIQISCLETYLQWSRGVQPNRIYSGILYGDQFFPILALKQFPAELHAPACSDRHRRSRGRVSLYGTHWALLGGLGDDIHSIQNLQQRLARSIRLLSLENSKART